MTIEEQLKKIVEDTFRCYNCRQPTDRYIKFRTAVGTISAFECLKCRQERVQEAVDKGLRPASDLLPENLPENR